MWLVAPVTARARPKSATLTRPSSESRTFSGLTSRWMSPAWWAAPSAASTGSMHLERLPRAEVAAVADQVAQRPAADELHGEEDVPLVGALVVDGDHVGVGEPGRRPCASRMNRETNSSSSARLGCMTLSAIVRSSRLSWAS